MCFETATFIGHGDAAISGSVDLMRCIRMLIENYHCKRFLCGGMGKFDLVCARAVWELKKTFPYVNGCYYIYYEFEITNQTEAAIDYIDVVTHVKNKSGEEIGTITSSFGGYYSESMELEAGETVTVTVSLSEHQPEKDEFFSLLYKTSLDQLSFSFEIQSVGFSDGERYSAEE